jgi:phosphopantothenoylcysteine decarboxylase/phosphopantothenate--cysteine ligase
VLVGFAAETENVVARATAKRETKHADLIVANDVSRTDAGFDVDTNAVTIVGADGAERCRCSPSRASPRRSSTAVESCCRRVAGRRP